MSWTWLFVWNLSWLVFALLWLSLETKPGGGPPQEGQGGDKHKRRAVQPPGKFRPVQAPRVYRR